MTSKQFLETLPFQLNNQQLEAVQAIDGPVLLLAVPGSGKTTVLVTRLGYMVAICKVPKDQILTITYTIAAANDIARRYDKIFGKSSHEGLEIRTINGICAKIILYYGKKIGKTAFELVTDEKEISKVLSSVYLKITKCYPTEADLKNVRTAITYVKNMMLDPEEISAFEEKCDFPLSRIYSEYNKVLRSANKMDYDDQMVYAYKMLKTDKSLLSYFQDKYRYICVDEAQDTSKIQHAIINLLASKHRNIFMVGDEDQSIYGFRAAYPDALLNFENNYKYAKVLLMEDNYRSNAKIVQAADKFIQRNKKRHSKHMNAVHSSGSEIVVKRVTGRNKQYDFLLDAAKVCKVQTAVLFRDNESGIPLVDILERNNVPYVMKSSELAFFSHRTILDFINICRFAFNTSDTELFMQIYYKIGLYIKKNVAEEMVKVSIKKHIPVLDAADHIGNIEDKTKQNINKIKVNLSKLKSDSAISAVIRVEETMGYKNYLERSKSDEGKLEILKALSVNEKNVKSLISRLNVLSNLYKTRENPSKCNFVLSTIHSSKGLEYDDVYLLDIADGIFPSDGEDVDIEEERRLFYVAVTRAKKNLTILSYDKSQFRSQLIGTERRINVPTNGLKSYRGQNNKSAAKLYESQSKTVKPGFEKFASEITEGTLVEHKVYGRGIVKKYNNDQITLYFQDIKKESVFSLSFLYQKNLIKLI